MNEDARERRDAVLAEMTANLGNPYLISNETLLYVEAHRLQRWIADLTPPDPPPPGTVAVERARLVAADALADAVRRWKASLRTMNLSLDADPAVAADQFSALLDEWDVVPNVLLRALAAYETAALRPGDVAAGEDSPPVVLP